MKWNKKEKEEFDKLLKEIGLKLQKRREEKGWSQKQLAKEVAMFQQQISKIEQGYVNFTLRTLIKIAIALDLKVEIGLKKE